MICHVSEVKSLQVKNLHSGIFSEDIEYCVKHHASEQLKTHNYIDWPFSVVLIWDYSYNILNLLKIYLKGISSLGVILLLIYGRLFTISGAWICYYLDPVSLSLNNVQIYIYSLKKYVWQNNHISLKISLMTDFSYESWSISNYFIRADFFALLAWLCISVSLSRLTPAPKKLVRILCLLYRAFELFPNSFYIWVYWSISFYRLLRLLAQFPDWATLPWTFALFILCCPMVSSFVLVSFIAFRLLCSSRFCSFCFSI